MSFIAVAEKRGEAKRNLEISVILFCKMVIKNNVHLRGREVCLTPFVFYPHGFT
jgi:hypothetical protein